MSQPKKQRITLDKNLAEIVRDLHHGYPQLGHEGIIRLLCDADVDVDEFKLRKFMDKAHLDAGPTATWSYSKDPLEFLQARLMKKGEGIG
jgi:hypothetical protein